MRLVIGLGALLLVGLGAGPEAVPPARRAAEPATPEVPPAAIAALQEGRFDEAEKALDALARDPKTPDDARSYLAAIRAGALRLAGRRDEARALLAAELKANPGGPWAAKVRSELAAVEVASGKFAAAEAIARAEAEALLAGDRKDRLAGIYRGFADRLRKPESPTVPPDPEGAYALLLQARSLAKTDAARASLLLALARASQEANNHPRAVDDFESYLREYPKGPDRVAARSGLGESQLLAGRPLPARLTWVDLARDLEKVDTREAAEARAKALEGIARTHGIPDPPDDAQLGLGVAALRRLVATGPSGPLASKAAYEIGASYLARGKSSEAIAAFEAFLKGDEAPGDPERSRLRMSARFRVAQVLQGQGKFDEAVAAYRGYLARHPDGPQSADAQRAVVDVQYQAAADLLRREKDPEARAGFLAFAAANPLDPRVPQALFEVGRTSERTKQFDEAVAAWETLAGKFPGTEPAGHAEFAIASTLEVEKLDPAAAIERFRTVSAEPWRARALQRVAVIEAKSLSVVTERAFRSGEVARLKVASRNLEKLTFTAYRIDPETYFRKKHALGGVEALDIGLVAPDAEWTAEVPGSGRFRPIEATYELKPLQLPGVYVVKVSDEKTLQATTMVLGTDLDAIVKTSRDQVLVFAQDMKTGKGRKGARVLVADAEGVLIDARLGDDGVLVRDWAPKGPQAPAPGDDPAARPRAPRGAVSYLVLDGDDVAGSGLAIPDKVAQGLSARAYLSTDRPAYRPGHPVMLRGVVREVVDGQYAVIAGATYTLEVFDSRGRKLRSRPLTLSEFGTFHESIALDPAAPVGTYRVRLALPGRSEYSGEFEVQAYQLEKVDLAFDLPRSVYYRGETIKGSVVARYRYGTPLAHRELSLALPDGRTVSARLDGEGKYAFELETTGFGEEQALRLVAQLPQDNVAAASTVTLAVRGFRVDLKTARDVYLDGESFAVDATTLDAGGEPTGQTLALALLKRVGRDGLYAEREAGRAEVVTDPRTGRGSARLQAVDEEGGVYVVRASGVDRFGNPVVAERVLTVSGRKDATKLRLLTDRTSFKVGEKAEVRLLNRGPAGTALLTWEADRVLAYRVVPVLEGMNAVAWDVAGKEFPNFTLAASRMAPPEFHEARLDLKVERDLRVTVAPKAPEVGPGGEVEVEVAAVDQDGRPVAAEVSLALVDRSLLRLFPDRLPPIDRFFHDRSRTSAFSAASTATFRYAPATVPVPEAVVEAQAQDAALAADAARQFFAKAEAAEPAMAAKPASAASAGEAKAKAMKRPMRAQSAAGLEDLAKDSELDKKLAELDMDGTRADKQSPARVPFRSRALFQAGRHGDRAGGWGEGGDEGAGSARERFADTAYWNPSVVTGPDGKATVKFKAPAALSEYRFTARGVSRSDTLVGQAGADLAVRKPFFVDLRTPASLTQGDRPRLSAEVHHKGLVGTLRLRLTAYAGGREVVMPKAIEVKADGVEEVVFDPFDVPDGDEVRLSLAATLGEARDELAVAVPIRPWGVQAYASASGSSADDASAFVALPPGREYADAEMLVVVSPGVRRMVVELALGGDAYHADRAFRRFPTPPDTTADRAGDLLGAGAALTYLRWARATGSPEALRLADRIRGLAAELTSTQNDDGGWPWVVGTRGQARPSDRLTSSRVAWALATARSVGLLPDPSALDRAANWLTQELAGVEGGDAETRSALVHALSALDRAGFEQANALNRARQGLSSASLAYLALTFANLDRASMGAEVLDLLAARGKAEAVAPGAPPRTSWPGEGQAPGHRSDAETTALAALAFARVRPESPELARAAEWLLAHRQGAGWQPPRARGPALAALAKYFAKGEPAEDRYRLVVTVNDEEVGRLEVAGPSEGKAFPVPRRVLRAGGTNRVRFDIEGRGRFAYSVSLAGFAREFGPDQDPANKPFRVHRRVYRPDAPSVDGRPIAQGFGVAPNTPTWENTVTQAAAGGQVTVAVEAYRTDPVGLPSWEREYLVIREYLPAGLTLVEGSVRTEAGHHTFEDGVLTAYFAPDQNLGISYDAFGSIPGQYRALPPSLSSVDEPGRRHLGVPADFKVLGPGEKSTDPYRVTPDELFARGKALFEAGDLPAAAPHLKALWGGYGLRDDVARAAARMLLTISIREYNPRDVVAYFEVLKEKAPDQVLSFDDIRAVGRAYGDLGEHERAFLVWRATSEASYLEDARVGEALRQRGRTLEAVAYLLGLWREYPSTPSIQADFFGLAQVIGGLAGRAIADPATRAELASAGVTRPDLFLQSIRLVRAFLAQSPRDPLADEASLALVGAFLDLEDFESVVRLSRRFAELYPKSSFLDSFQYSEALGRFHLGEYDRAIAVAGGIAAATYKDPGGVDQPSPNKWQAIYILGQIHDARREPAKALAFYEQVAGRFSDAAGAVKALTRKELKLPEVTVVRPGDEAPSARLDYRNVASADVKVYPVDLMRLYLTRRNLDAIAGVDLAGIKPFHSATIPLGDGRDFDDRSRPIDLPVKKEGAYLVMARGDDRYASGILLVSPLEMQVLEEPESGRVRVTVRDAKTKAFVPRVQVKVIGSQNPSFHSGETDLRGVFVAEGMVGQVTAVARKGTGQYAFHRGTAFVGTPATPATPPPAKSDRPADGSELGDLRENVRGQNTSNQLRQLQRLQDRYKADDQGVKVQKAY